MEPAAIKSFGYLVSMLSVILLGVVSWKAASSSPNLLLCLVMGMIASVLGMLLRWLSYRIEERRMAERSKRPMGDAGRQVLDS